jgi:hypothetical protein
MVTVIVCEWDPTQKRWVLDPGDFDWYPNDDDYNGYCDDLVGFDFTKLSYCDPNTSLVGYDPQPCSHPGCWGDHGDKTAGTAAAVTNNSITTAEATWICDQTKNSVAGTSWYSKIMIARIRKTIPLTAPGWIFVHPGGISPQTVTINGGSFIAMIISPAPLVPHLL